ncbi:hypothetical protein AN2423.2 [Aspergillus nidulans FGSC A4]|uniref:Malate dehydrogenase (AFU_orthologue AFUA_2G13800) n=1 Tax=Emericella nidulans (strain FGSC A4 / ATCC 38163 / CBS 112.46 / NRRL 194 / M139) TaxID=227321 RepID=Q5BAK7_EMENI|nr:hypothetical protein [Aspergillus nidulans FGSC A4]EAA64534.1 hypothetical protein AN2423.2 [Aspergillus nidulans FGSC A4]CBF86818.1 TPA: malate dehydrogenase (AFU_orthologue; AFUA_2G13800) [Aspergillus nidulans FGSC A4]|eukprot:XP_660027.1 hypothetical protein AN2423.2 [Aspergillus nidulans FGSC A4]
MIWATSTLVPFLCITAVTALPARFDFYSFFHPNLIKDFLQNTQLAGCVLPSTTTLSSSSLSAPSSGLSLKAITLGRGTQNYTCAGNTAATTPEATGATATLFDTSCLVAANVNADRQPTLHFLPDSLKTVPLSNLDLFASLLSHSSGQNIAVGKHYFTADGTPFFDLRGSEMYGSGWIAAKKEDEEDAPAKPGYGITGDVAWLKLTAIEGSLSFLKEVYRIHTAGGSAPATCEDMPEDFTVDYAAEYWFYGDNE